jgi:hypothetical protein
VLILDNITQLRSESGAPDAASSLREPSFLANTRAAVENRWIIRT